MQEIYPEIIQGLWWCVRADDPTSPTRDLFAFDADGTFVRVVYKQGARRDAESGDYTFDGSFLIVRGRSTETYRVSMTSSTQWSLDGKRHRLTLARALPVSDPLTLDESTTRMLRLVPQRVSLELLDKALPRSFRMMYAPDASAPPIELGTVHTFEQHPGTGWVGLHPAVECSPPEDAARVWQAVASKAVRPALDVQWERTWVRVVTHADTDTPLE